jgi:polyhydroxybutyrate depolymerase
VSEYTRRSMRSNFLLSAFFPVVFLLACGSGGAVNTGAGATGGAGGATASSGGGASDAGTSDGGPVGGDRPVSVHVPPGYSQSTPAPLVVMLHGYSASGDLEEIYLGITAESNKRGFIYVHPDGTIDKMGQHFWNASDACCNFDGSTVDDSGYLSAVIADIQSRYSIDPKRIWLIGHSNGAFMSYRMACDHADQIAAIVSLAGAMPSDPSGCKPSAPVSILEIHGTADAVIAYDGSALNGHPFPSAPVSVSDWVTIDGCAPAADTSAPPLDLDSVLPGDETAVTRYAGCKPGGHAELWTIAGGSHIPTPSPTFTSDMVDFLYAHPKP